MPRSLPTLAIIACLCAGLGACASAPPPPMPCGCLPPRPDAPTRPQGQPAAEITQNS